MFKINRFALAAFALAVGAVSAADDAAATAGTGTGNNLRGKALEKDFLREVAGEDGGRKLAAGGCACHKEGFGSCGRIISESLQRALLSDFTWQKRITKQLNDLSVFDKTATFIRGLPGTETQKLEKIEKEKANIVKLMISQMSCLKVSTRMLEKKAYKDFRTGAIGTQALMPLALVSNKNVVAGYAANEDDNLASIAADSAAQTTFSLVTEHGPNGYAPGALTNSYAIMDDRLKTLLSGSCPCDTGVLAEDDCPGDFEFNEVRYECSCMDNCRAIVGSGGVCSAFARLDGDSGGGNHCSVGHCCCAENIDAYCSSFEDTNFAE